MASPTPVASRVTGSEASLSGGCPARLPVGPTFSPGYPVINYRRPLDALRAFARVLLGNALREVRGHEAVWLGHALGGVPHAEPACSGRLQFLSHTIGALSVTLR